MPVKVFVRPKRGLKVPDPDMGDLFPHEGREVDRNVYIEHRIGEGSLIVVEAKADEKPASEKPAAAAKRERT